MIVSTNSSSHYNDFNSLLHLTKEQLDINARKSNKKILALTGSKIELYIKNIMTELAIDTPFENSIELIGGHKFPDIVAKKYYGVEIKTTTQNHWRTSGNSVLETTRVAGVERIFLLFAKLNNPIEFRIRPYEEVLSDIVVTHSPRYLIDMNLDKGKTIFDKIKIPYDEFRKKENPIKHIIDYYNDKLEPGEELWWINSDNTDKTTNIIIKTWSNLPIQEAQNLKICAMVFFPEIFGNSRNKFSKFALWLVTSKSVVCPNVRDLFTSGGKSDFVINNIILSKVPRIFLNLFENYKEIKELILQTSAYELSQYWKIKTTENKKMSDWINLVTKYSKQIHDTKHLNIEKVITCINKNNF